MTGSETPASLVARAEFVAIAKWVKPGAQVLDLGCGDGALLRYLNQTRGAKGYGMEIDDARVLACVKNGVNVLQRDLETGLAGFEDGSFDCVILSQTLQAIRRTERIIREMLRVGREGIVSFPNFGNWHMRLQVLGGHMPVSKELPYQWYDTPNIHLSTIADFENFCTGQGVRILERLVMHEGQRVNWLLNLRGSLAVYRLGAGQ
ncbi:MAG: methionine biosynthesis protein MetW [Burkholderiales bacterium]